jgi:hypothetical protein
MFRALATAHVVIAILLLPVALLSGLFAPIILIGPVWSMLLARRMWRREPAAIRPLRRTHFVFLAIDAILIWYGVWMLRAAEESARRGGGLLGGLGVIPIAIGGCLAVFSTITLLLTVRMRAAV